MKHIIIDTNVVHNDYMLTGYRISALCSAKESLGYSVFIPDVVVDEIVKQYKEEIEGYAEQYNQALNQLKKRKTLTDIIAFDSNTVTDNYEQTLRNRIAELCIGIIPYPQTAHKEMVLRELSKRKPFKDSSKGYRDSLIWESIKEHCLASQNVDVVFLTENTDDFAAKDKTSLHPDLINDCEAIGYDVSKLTLISGVHRYVEQEIVSKSAALEDLLEFLRASDYLGNIDLLKCVKDYITHDNMDSYINGDSYGESVIYVPGYYENPVIAGMDTHSITFDSIHEISKTELLVKCSIEIELDLDVFIYHGDVPLISEDMLPYIFDYEWNDHYAAASDSAVFKLQLNIICDKDMKNVISIDDEVIQVDYSTGYHFES